jgi:hypothetical protein
MMMRCKVSKKKKRRMLWIVTKKIGIEGRKNNDS